MYIDIYIYIYGSAQQPPPPPHHGHGPVCTLYGGLPSVVLAVAAGIQDWIWSSRMAAYPRCTAMTVRD